MPICMICALIICALAINTRTCVICGHPATNIPFCSNYCTVCLKIMSKGLHKSVRRRALIAAWNKDADAFLCYYTGVKLDVQGPFSPFYLTFDHAIPGDNTRFVVCARFVNEVKNEMSETEFRTNICLLAKHFRTGEPIDQAMFKLEYYRPKPKNPVARWFAALKDLMTPRSQIVEHCKVCGKEPLRGRTYCERCRRLVLGEMDRNVKVETLKAAYDKDVDGFRCHYTGFLLDLNDRASPWHLNFDHCFPGRPGKYWLACQIINLMKTELSEEEFMKVVIELARHFETGAPYDRDIIKFEYWKRPRQ